MTSKGTPKMALKTSIFAGIGVLLDATGKVAVALAFLLH